MKDKKVIKKYKPPLSRDDVAMLREKNNKDYKKRRISDYHIDAA